MRAQRAYQAVQNTTGVASANPVGLAVLLFERISDLLTKAESAFLHKDIEARAKHTSKAIELIELGLVPSLDRERGGAIAENLSFLYKHWVAIIMDANLKGDPTKLAGVKSQIRDIVSAFLEVSTN